MMTERFRGAPQANRKQCAQHRAPGSERGHMWGTSSALQDHNIA